MVSVSTSISLQRIGLFQKKRNRNFFLPCWRYHYFLSLTLWIVINFTPWNFQSQFLSLAPLENSLFCHTPKFFRRFFLTSIPSIDYIFLRFFVYSSILILLIYQTVCQTKLDLAIVVDTSGSVGFNNFRKVQTFLKSLVDFFNIGRDETHIALVSYSYSVRIHFIILYSSFILIFYILSVFITNKHTTLFWRPSDVKSEAHSDENC